jgi:hypothetical protein
MASSSAPPSGLAFRRMVPCRKNASCGIVFRRERTCDLETREMSIPSTRIDPLLRSRSLRIVETREDFPLNE